MQGVPFATGTPGSSADHTSLLAVSYDEGAEFGSTLLRGAGGTNVATLLHPDEPGRFPVAVAEQGEVEPSGDYEARLLVANLLRPAEPNLLDVAASGQDEDVPSDVYEARLLATRAPLEDNEARLLAARARRRAEPRQRRSSPSLGPSEGLPPADFESQLLASGIANPGGAEHLERNRLWDYNHGEDF